MRYKNINNSLFKKNRKKLQDKLSENEIAVLFSASPKHRNGDQFFKYRQDSDFFYFSGIEQEESVLIVSKTKEFLFILKPDKKTEIWEGKKLTINESSDISGIEKVYYKNDFYDILKSIISKKNTFFIQKTDNKNIRNFKSYLKKHKKNFIVKNISDISTKLRLIKEPEEIEIIKKAVSITGKAFDELLKNIRPGMYEYELEAIVTKVFIENGAAGHAYEPIVASGKNACFLHYIKNDDLLKDNELVLFDIGAEYANYAADLSRTIPSNGKFTSAQKDLYNAVLDVQQELIATEYVPGNTIENINKKSAELMEQKMIELGLFTKEEAQKSKDKTPLYFKYFMHGTSHFMGLDVHDCGTKTTKLQAGMILTCEPGLYIAERSTGIRIENDILISNNGAIDLMADIPVKINDLEVL